MEIKYKFSRPVFGYLRKLLTCVYVLTGLCIFNGVIFVKPVSADPTEGNFKKLFSETITAKESHELKDSVLSSSDKGILFKSMVEAYAEVVDKKYEKFKTAGTVSEHDLSFLHLIRPKGLVPLNFPNEGISVLSELLEDDDFCTLGDPGKNAVDLPHSATIALIEAMFKDALMNAADEEFSCVGKRSSSYYCVWASYIDRCSEKWLKSEESNSETLGTYMLFTLSPGIPYETFLKRVGDFLRRYDRNKMEKMMAEHVGDFDYTIFLSPILGFNALFAKWRDMPYKVERYLFKRFKTVVDLEKRISCVYNWHAFEPVLDVLVFLSTAFSTPIEERYILDLLNEIMNCEDVNMLELADDFALYDELFLSEDEFIMNMDDMPLFPNPRYWERGWGRGQCLGFSTYALLIKNNFVFRKDLPKPPESMIKTLFDPSAVFDRSGKKLREAGFHMNDDGKFVIPGYANLRELTGEEWKFSWALRKLYKDGYKMDKEFLYFLSEGNWTEENLHLNSENVSQEENKKIFTRLKNELTKYREALIISFLFSADALGHSVIAVGYMPEREAILCLDNNYTFTRTYSVLAIKDGIIYYGPLGGDEKSSKPVSLIDISRISNYYIPQ